MSRLDKNQTSNAIAEAIRAKRENRSSTATEIALLEEALLADIESFDLDAAEQQANHQRSNYSGAGMLNASMEFPEIAPIARDFHQIKKPAKPAVPEIKADNSGKTGFLDNLRHQAALRQQEMHSAQAERSSLNDSIDSALKKIFYFLHEMVQQLNIVKPLIPRRYALVDKFELQDLEWQEGFADYRTQSQSAGALMELVSFTYQISTMGSTLVDRDGLTVERFRTMLFDYGLQFSCREFRNERHYIERAEFDIKPQVSVSARWCADFEHGKIILESRNLDRLGSVPYTIRPEAIDQELLDAFGGLVLGQPNRFRELSRR